MADYGVNQMSLAIITSYMGPTNSRVSRAIAERDSALEQSGLQWQHDAESCGYRPGDSVAVLNALREQREARDAEIWMQFNNQ
jgi:hypothetical protein